MDELVTKEIVERIRSGQLLTGGLLDEVRSRLEQGDLEGGRALLSNELEPVYREQRALVEALLEVLIVDQPPEVS